MAGFTSSGQNCKSLSAHRVPLYALGIVAATILLGIDVFGHHARGDESSDKRDEQESSRVLFVLDQDEFIFKNYIKLHYLLDQSGVRLEVASLAIGDAVPGSTGQTSVEVAPGVNVKVEPVECLLSLETAHAEDYGVVVFTGGWLGQFETGRGLESARELINDMLDNGGAIVSFGSGTKVLTAAGVLEGHDVAAHRKYQDLIEKAGARYFDAPYKHSGQLITARSAADACLVFKELEKTGRIRGTSTQKEGPVETPTPVEGEGIVPIKNGGAGQYVVMIISILVAIVIVPFIVLLLWRSR